MPRVVRSPYTRLGRFDVGGEIARGGMGAVYEGRDRQTGAPVAIKVLLAEGLLNEKHRRRLGREVEALGRIAHPHVVGLRGAGRTPDGAPYLAMEWVPGESLEQRLRGGPLEPRVAAQLVAELASGVGAAHAAGLLHRDMKPDNVLIASDGRAVLVDFGLARDLAQERSRLTATGAMVGTPSYWSPEQAAGKPEAIGPATDVFGLGAILFAALTGEPPRQPRTLGEALRLAQTPTPRASSVRAGVPAALDRLCQRCMALEPAARPSVEELRAALALWVAPSDETVSTASPPPQRRRAWGLAAAVALGVVGLGALAVSRGGTANDVAQAQAPLRDTSDAARERLERARQALALGRSPEDLQDLLGHTDRGVAETARILWAQAVATDDPQEAQRLLQGVRASQARPQRAFVGALLALAGDDLDAQQQAARALEDGALDDTWLQVRLRQAALARCERLAARPLEALQGPLELMAALPTLPGEGPAADRLLRRIRAASSLEQTPEAIANAQLYGESPEVRGRLSEALEALTWAGAARLSEVDRWLGFELAGQLDLAYARGGLTGEQALRGLSALVALDVPLDRGLLAELPEPRGAGVRSDFLRLSWHAARALDGIHDEQSEQRGLESLARFETRLRAKLVSDSEWVAGLGPRVRAAALLESLDGSRHDAPRLLEQVRACDPQNPHVLLHEAWAAQERGSRDEALAGGRAALAALPYERDDLGGLAADEVEHLWGDVAILYAELGELARAHALVDQLERAPWVSPLGVSGLRAELEEVAGEAVQGSSPLARAVYGVAR